MWHALHERRHRMESSYKHLLIDSQDGILVVTMNRPERRNALSAGLMRELIDCFDSVESDSEIRAVILAASGPVFSAGHDLRELVGGSLKDYRLVFDVCTELMTRL